MLAADPDLQVLAHLPAAHCGHLDELPDACPVEDLERVLVVDPHRDVIHEELSCVVAREATSHLREVVRPEAEELGLGRDLVGGDRCAGDLDHRPDQNA